MPFVSRLKKLGTLPVPELSTNLIVHLIQHDGSQDTNIVYTACNPISADIPPPTTIRFDCPAVHTKPGDVLLWASRVHKKACFVHACWVFNGSEWLRPSSNSEIMMDHPQKPDYQLVVLSGPHVRWEPKADPDREPSLTIPDPPLLRPGARGTVNTIVGVPNATLESPSHHSHETPDGSAGICGSDSPLSCIDDDDLAQLGSLTKILPVAASDTIDPPTPIAKVAQRVRERPRGARASPSARQITPLTTAPLTPDSSKHARSRIVRRKDSNSSASSSRQCKRTRTGDDIFMFPSRRTSMSSPASKRRKLDTSARADPLSNSFSLPTTTLSRRTSSNNQRNLSGAQTISQVAPETGQPSIPQQNHTSTSAQPMASQLNIRESVPQDSNVNQRPCPTSGEELRNFTPFNLLSPPPPPLPLKTETIEVPAEFLGMTLVEDDFTEHVLVPPPSEQGRVEELSRDRVLSDAQRQDHVLMTTTLQQAHQLRAELSRSQMALVELERESVEKIAELTKDRDQVISSFDGFKVQAAKDIDELRRRVDDALGSQPLREVHSAQTDSQENVIMQLQTVTAERDELAKMVKDFKGSAARQPKDVVVPQTSEDLNRCAVLQNLLLAAQDGLHRQRTLAQESEARQQGTISQLTREILQKNAHADELSNKVVTMGKRIRELQASSETREQSFLEEKQSFQHKIVELEKLQSTAHMDTDEIARLNDVVTSKDRALIAAEEQCACLNDQLLQDRTSQDTAIAQLAQIRADLERELQEARASLVHVEQMSKNKDDICTQERAARKTVGSRLDLCLHQFHEHLRISDRERQAVEHLLLSQQSTYSRAAKDKAVQLESVQTDLIKLESISTEQRRTLQALLTVKSHEAEKFRAAVCQMRVEWLAEKTKLGTEFRARDERLSETINERTAIKNDLAQREEELSQAREQCSSLQSSLSAEKHLGQELVSQLVQINKELSQLREKSNDMVQMRDEAQAKLAEVQSAFQKQSRSLSNKQEQCFKLTRKVSDSDLLTKKLSSTVRSLEQELAESLKQLHTLRKQYSNTEGELRTQQRTNEVKANQAAEALQRAQADSVKQAESLKLERRRIAEDLSTVSREVALLAERLHQSQSELAQSKNLLAKEQAIFKFERERLIVELASSSKNSHALQKQFSEAQEQHNLLQQSLEEQKISFEEDNRRLASEHSATLEELAVLKRRILESEAKRADFQNNLEMRTMELSEERAARLKIELEIVDAKGLFEDLSASSLSLEEELKDCQLKLTVVEDRARHLEREEASLQSRITFIATDLKSSQAECARLRVESESEAAQAHLANQTTLKSISDELTAAQAECSRLQGELTCEKDKLKIERTLSPDDLRGRLAAVESGLEEEKNLTRSLREEIAKEPSSNYWAELGSQLLRSLHEVQDELQVERKARKALQTQLSMKRSEEAAASRRPSTADLLKSPV